MNAVKGSTSTLDISLVKGGRHLIFLDLTVKLNPVNSSFSGVSHPSTVSPPPSGGSSSSPTSSIISSSSLIPSFSIYRKPSYTGILINGGSFHPQVHQRAGIMAMIHRLLSIPLSPDDEFNSEQGSIIYLAHLNNLQIDVEKIISETVVSFLVCQPYACYKD